MNPLKRSLTLGTMALVGILSLGAGGGNSAKSLLSPVDQLVDYLTKDWGTRFHSTTIPHAMENLSMPADDNLRLEVVEHFRDNPRLSRNLRAWGANNYLFSQTERRLAKLLLNSQRDAGKLPSAEAAGRILGLSLGELQGRLAFMARAGFLTAEKDQPLGYSLVEDAELWGGPLRHNYHTVIREGVDKFDVW